MEEVSFCWKGITASAQVGPPFRKKKKVILDNGEESINKSTSKLLKIIIIYCLSWQ